MGDRPRGLEREEERRMGLQLRALESPSVLPTRAGGLADMYTESPMTNLSRSLGGAVLCSPSPLPLSMQQTKKTLFADTDSEDGHSPNDSLGSLGSNDSPAPMVRTMAVDTTPLSSIGNRLPTRRKLEGLVFGRDRVSQLKGPYTSLLGKHDFANTGLDGGESDLTKEKKRRSSGLEHYLTDEDKENRVPRSLADGGSPGQVLGSPGGRPARSFGPSSGRTSPGKEPPVRRANSVPGDQKPRRKRSFKRTIFADENEDSRDSGFASQQLEPDSQEDFEEAEQGAGKRSRPEEEVEVYGQEEGIAALPVSPEAKEPRSEPEARTDDLYIAGRALEAVVEQPDAEEQESTRPLIAMSGLLGNKISPSSSQLVVPGHKRQKNIEDFLVRSAVTDHLMRRPEPRLGLGLAGGPVRPRFGLQRAVSMIEQRSVHARCDSLHARHAGHSQSPVSRGAAGSIGFKRPEPPAEGLDLLGGKRRRVTVGPGAAPCHNTLHVDAGTGRTLPGFSRSMSETELNIMKSCQLKEDTEDILPDSSRLYALPGMPGGGKHPSLRSISCDTLAQVLRNEHSDKIRSYRIVDCRYKYEFSGGHIRQAENWQHGEDEEFLGAFLGDTPLDSAPPSYDSATHDKAAEQRRDILVFHCEFSSHRGPDFCKKLRERDRSLNKEAYPGLIWPECYLLHLGYKEFYRSYPELCTGGYTLMADPHHDTDLRRMRAKSKSWSGGTVSRTGKMSRVPKF